MKTKIDWAHKLTSRKFWAAFLGFIVPLLVIFGVDAITIEQVVALVSSMAVLISYIVGEGMVDKARINKGGEHIDESGVSSEDVGDRKTP